ncbi:probable glucuronosyltransferase Os01g0157700 [Triticum urartu]|uniref:probable glucuronosyltransferase Os01g0157700 n=1 Tax=Triticum urartu TaxID=4572 RepID=UPI0020431E8F|nr:probable glucuronosyltransferase Os01g0157700 [Triticum urartu]
MDSVERSRRRAQRWSKRKAAVVHLAVCFVVGAFAPLVATRGPLIDGIRASFLPFGGVQRVAPPSAPAAPDIGLLLIVTVTRPDDDVVSQEASLTRLGHTLRLVPPPLLWIVVGAENRSASTVQVLRGTGVMFRHLTYAVGQNNATNITTAVNNATTDITVEASATTAVNTTTNITMEASATTAVNTTTNITVEASATTAVNNATNNITVEAIATTAVNNTTTMEASASTTMNNATTNTVEASTSNTTTAAEKNGTNNTIVEDTTSSASNTTITAEKNGANDTIVENNTTGNVNDEADLKKNVALSHIERHRLAGVVHFAAASAIYDLEFFEELRQTRGVAAWPTATVSSAEQRVTVQGPTCNSSQITGWYSKDSGTNETHRESVAAAQDTGAIQNISSSPPAIETSGLGFRSSILWESEWFVNSNSSQDFIQLVREMAVGDGDERKGIPSNCSESRIMLWHLDMPKHTPEVEEQETPQERSPLEEDEEDYMT